MRRKSGIYLIVLGVLAVAACVTSDENNDTANATTNNATTNNDTANVTTNNATTNNATTNNATTNNASAGWSIAAHSCVGNRTDALWCDDAQTCFVGCGTTTTGTGLFFTTDGGANWEAVTTTPAAFFDTARVNTISRSSDGLLYVGGDLPNSAAVVSVADDGTVAEVFTRGQTVDFSFTPGRFRRASNEWAIAESLTGVDLVYREADGGDPTDSWETGRGFWSDGDADDVAAGVQILDLEVYNDEFYAAGSLINQPPTAFLPKWTANDFDFSIVHLATGLGEFDGEMWGIDVNDDGIVLGGVDQDRDVGMVYSIDHATDGTDAGNWTAFDVSTVFPDNTTWITDVCRGDGIIYAVGRESSQGWGFILESTDGGTSFTDVTPYDGDGDSLFDDLTRCQVVADGVIVAGAGGLFARNF